MCGTRGFEPWEEICEFKLDVDGSEMEPESGSIAHVVEEGLRWNWEGTRLMAVVAT